MSTIAVSPVSVAARRRRLPVWTFTRWLAVILYVAGAVVMAVQGERVVAAADLEQGLASHAVTEVRIEGAMGGPGGLVHGEQGYGEVRLVWHDGLGTKVTEVLQATSRDELERGLAQRTDEHPTPTPVIGRVDTWLRTFSPEVRTTWGNEPGSSWRLGPWQVHGQWMWVGLAAFGATLLAAAFGPEPRLATSAGWVWLLLSPCTVLTMPLYLFVGARGMRPGEKRLTGRWAFLLAFFLLPAFVLPALGLGR